MKGWKRKAGVHHGIAERYSSAELEKNKGPWRDPTDKLYFMTEWDKANPPELVVQRARYYNTQTISLWCYYHGQYCSVIPVREGARPTVNRSECQCPECIVQGMYFTGEKIR